MKGAASPAGWPRGWILAARLLACATLSVLVACQNRTSSEVQSTQVTAQVASTSEPIDRDCFLPSPPRTLLEEDGVVLKVWSFAFAEVHSRSVLPADSGLLAYRAAVRANGSDVRRPRLHVPSNSAAAQAEMWRDEAHNNGLAFSGAVGSIDPISCLDALMFAEQNARVPQLDQPSEFLASVLRRGDREPKEVIIVFGAGNNMFPPKSAYGLEVVDEYLARGWTYWYVLHNHPRQPNGDAGIPAPSTVDVQFVRALAKDKGLESVRVTNGFYTFSASVAQLTDFRAR
jgi:hypothetical protein